MRLLAEPVITWIHPRFLDRKLFPLRLNRPSGMKNSYSRARRQCSGCKRRAHRILDVSQMGKHADFEIIVSRRFSLARWLSRLINDP